LELQKEGNYEILLIDIKFIGTYSLFVTSVASLMKKCTIEKYQTPAEIHIVSKLYELNQKSYSQERRKK